MSDPTVISAESIRAAIHHPEPMMEALSSLLKSVSSEAVAGLVTILGMLGVDAKTMPGTFFAQAILVEADKAFAPISREDWILVYDSYERIKAVLAANPDIRAELAGMHAEMNGTDTLTDALLDGEF